MDLLDLIGVPRVTGIKPKDLPWYHDDFNRLGIETPGLLVTQLIAGCKKLFDVHTCFSNDVLDHGFKHDRRANGKPKVVWFSDTAVPAPHISGIDSETLRGRNPKVPGTTLIEGLLHIAGYHMEHSKPLAPDMKVICAGSLVGDLVATLQFVVHGGRPGLHVSYVPLTAKSYPTEGIGHSIVHL